MVYIFAGNNIAPYLSNLFAEIKISHELRIFDANIYIICKVSTALNMTKIVQILFFRPYINIVEILYFHVYTYITFWYKNKIFCLWMCWI